MIVVADASPLNYLILIDAIEILPRLYRRVLVPRTVIQELQDSGAPPRVRAWSSRPPAWCEIQRDSASDPKLSFLDPGERAAIVLAVRVRADRLLIDDLAGRTEAKRRQLAVIGTVGVLAEAQLAGLLDFEQALAGLRATNFRLHPEIENRLRRRLSSEQDT
jgi:predicted nucleic acid-binding protein